MQLTLNGLSLKTSQESLAPKTMPSAVSWGEWLDQIPNSFQQEGSDGLTQVWLLDPSEPPRGESLMPNIWAWPNDGDVSLCSLSEVLETGPVPQRYYLSPTACRGILRRAKRREKELPDAFKGGSGSRGWSDPSDGNGGGMVEVSGTLGRGYGDRGRDIDGAGESVPFTTSSHGSYDEGIGTLRSNGGDIGGGSETIIAHAVTCHHAKGGDPTTDNYLVTGGFFDSPIGTMACNTGPNGHDAGNFQSNQGVDSGYVIPVAYGFSGESDGSTVRNASDMARTITNRHGDPGFVAIQNATRGQDQNGLGISEDGTMYTLDQGSQHAVAWNIQDQNTGKSIKAKPSEISTCLGTRDLSKYQGTFNADVIQSVMQVRRLTPVECSRLQGVPDLYLDITYRGKPLADGLKYKLLGNGFAVPVVKYIGTRIQLVEDLINGIS